MRVPFVDSLVNFLTGLGTGNDKSSATVYSFTPLDPAQLEMMFRGDWIARKCVAIPAQDATREWRRWQADIEGIEDIEATEKKHRVQQKLKSALIQSRLYGGAVLIIGIKGQAPETPLDVETVGQDDLEFIHVLNRHQLTTGPVIKDVTSEWYGEPEWFSRAGAEQLVKIHPSRVIRFIGNEFHAQFTNLSRDEGWGDSILQSVDDAVKGAGTVVQTIASMVQEVSVDVINVPGLTERVANEEYRKRLLQRFSLANLSKSTNNALVLDENEKWQRITHNFSTLPELIMTYLTIAAGACDIPATRMLSQSPNGLNATGESDIRNYYDMVADLQKNSITPVLDRLDEVLIRSALGSRDDSIFYVWSPLWQLDEVQKAELANKKAQTYKIDAESWIGDPAALQRAREQQLIEDQVYPALEMELEESDFDIDAELEADKALAALLPGPPGSPANTNLPEEGGTEPAPVQRPALPAPSRRVRAGDSGAALKGRRRARPRSAFRDATKPRTLYVRRDVLNAGEILAWARAQGFKDLYDAKELHVTIVYSRTPIDWMTLPNDYWGSEDGKVTIQAGGPRVVEVFGVGERVAVIAFASNALQYRHRDFIEAGAEHGFPDYQPHISFARDFSEVDLDTVVPYRGTIELGPEIFEEIDPNK